MPSLVEGYISTKISRFLMTYVGMRYGNSKREQSLINGLLAYMIVTILIAVFVEGSDLIYSRNDLHAITYNAPCSLSVLLDFTKLMIFIYKRRELFELNRFADNAFWKRDYEEADKKILDQCNITSALGMTAFCSITSMVAIHYLVGPYIDALGTNSTEKVLPFRVVYDWPVTETPYYEIMYTIEVVVSVNIAICAVTFASYLFNTNVFVTGQFQILQRRLEIICDVQLKTSHIKSSSSANCDKPVYEKLKDCSKQHQLLIWYLGQLEDLFCYILLVYVLCIVMILCFSGFQLVLGTQESSFHRQILSVEYLFACTVQLVLFAFSCNEIMEASAAIGEAAYRCKWYNLPWDENGRAVRQGLTIIVMRSRQPCTLTVGNFCPMTLQVFTSVLSTALSYLTVLRSMNE